MARSAQGSLRRRAEGIVSVAPPSTAAISRMEEAITWNRFLERDDAHLMWARAEGEDRSEAGEVERLAAMGVGHQANSTGTSG